MMVFPEMDPWILGDTLATSSKNIKGTEVESGGINLEETEIWVMLFFAELFEWCCSYVFLQRSQMYDDQIWSNAVYNN